MPSLSRLGLVGALAAAAACSEPRQAPTILLSRPGDTVITALVEVPQGVWLGDQRWAVVAPSDSTVVVVDFTSHKTRPLAPAKADVFSRPFSIFSVGRDTVFVGDWARRRLTAWTADGRLVDSVPAPDLSRGTLPTDRDASGRWYAERPPAPRPRGAANRDSTLVLRLSPDLKKADTVAALAPLDVVAVQGDQGRRLERRVFSGNDAWGALPDGSVWLARVNANRVLWIAPDGSITEGDALPDRVLQVTAEDRELFAQRFPPELRDNAQQLPFAIVKPPFVRGFADPDGNVWLEKSRSIVDTMQSYQVVDRQGHLMRTLQLPGWGKILAVAPTRALVAEGFKDGVRLLEVEIPPADTVQ